MNTLLRYHVVSAAGIAVQLAALYVLRDVLGVPYLWATAAAVEFAVVHNFYWHWRWTWAARQVPLGRFVQYQCTTGLVSIGCNLFAMRLLTGVLGLPLIPANALSIGFAWVFNFLTADRYVFRLR